MNNDGCTFCNLFNRITVGMYNWKKTRFPDPGAENCAFDTLTLPMLLDIGNINYAVLSQLRGVGPEPFIIAQQTVPTGLAGIISGQLITPPLTGNEGN